MGIFNWLPQVNRFCWCTRNLKCASFIVTFLGMFTSIHAAGLLVKPACSELFLVPSPVRLTADVLRWILFVFEIFLMASCFAFMLGIFWSLPITADILLACAITTSLISILYAIFMMVQEQYTNCRWYYSQIFHLILYLIMWSYFVIVVNSYKEQNM